MISNKASINPKIYFIREVEQSVGRDRLTLRRMWRKGTFPKPTLINNRLAWGSNVIDQWISETVNGRISHEE
jgi:predicted DNA-binding transcriptional regulator AlpA